MRYERLFALGSGGTATVDLALTTGPGGFNRLVVLKSTRKEFSTHEDAEKMFLAEARLSARLDWSSLELEPSSFVDEQLRGRQADLLFKVDCAGHAAFLYLLFEHQSTSDAFMAKYTASGSALWAKRFGTGGTEYATDVAVDPTNNGVVVTGAFNGIINLGLGNLLPAGVYDVFLGRFTP